MSDRELNQPKAAPLMATWICLVIAWILFLVPVPGAGLFVGWPMNLVAFILAIVVMTRGRTIAGLIPLISSLVVSPIVYFIGLAIFAAVIGSAGKYDEYAQRAQAAQQQGSTQRDAAPAGDRPGTSRNDIEVTSRQLLADYMANEVSADNQYKNKALAVTGRVAAINKDFADEVYVELETAEMFQLVQAHGISAQVAAQLQKGQQVTMDCVGNGYLLGTPQLQDCRLR